MSLADLRETLASGMPLDGHRTAPDAQEAPTGAEQGEPQRAVEEAPYGVAQVVTPSGIEIYYQAGPKRLYRVRDPQDAQYEGDEGWQEVVSVSTALDVLEKGGLSHWGQGVGVNGVLELVALGELTWED